LGGRSILGDARSPDDAKAPEPEGQVPGVIPAFRAVGAAGGCRDWFDLDTDSPYMQLVADVSAKHRIAMTREQQSLFGIDRLNVPRSSIPAVTHVDYSARVQTVHRETNPRYHALLERFKALTGCPVVVNTSFNVRGEPIVCTPEDAFRCFMGTDIDVLAVGNCLLRKEDQDPSLATRYERTFEPD
jgi:carbamoyltransferase